MRFASLGSGSRGNGTLIESGDHRLLIDCGFTLKDTLLRLQRLGVEPESIDAIAVTHEHSDHVGGVARFARRFGTEVWSTLGSAARERLSELPGYRRVSLQANFAVGAMTVTPVAVPHDAREPCQFVVQGEGRKLGVLSDLGSITAHVTAGYQHCDALVLECNHDPQMLREGPYPPSLKRRVGGDWGHLSNAQAASLLGDIAGEQLQHTVIAHVSDKNNTSALAQGAIEPVLNGRGKLQVACQERGFDWIDIA